MDNLASDKQFKSLLDLVEADQAEWREEELDDDVLERAALGNAPLGPPPPPVTSVPGLFSQVPCPSTIGTTRSSQHQNADPLRMGSAPV
jgi:hypothetical protein